MNSYLVYSEFTVKKLKEICSQRSIYIKSTMKKSDIIDTLVSKLMTIDDLLKNADILPNDNNFLYEDIIIQEYLSLYKNNYYFISSKKIYNNCNSLIVSTLLYKHNILIGNMVLKTFVDKVREDELIHEFYISYILNTIGNIIPNFSILYDAIILPYSVNDYIVKDKLYLIYDKIEPSIAFKDYIKKDKSKLFFTNFMRNYLQILLSLQIAYELCKFTHYDLHYSNILIKKTSEFPHITYSTAFGTYNIKTNGELATIIDYGRSYLKYNNLNHGHMFNYSNPMHDAFKLLQYSVNIFPKEFNNNGIYLLSFFFKCDDSKIFQTLNTQPRNYYIDIKYFNIYTLPDFIVWCIDYCKTLDLDIFENE